MQGRAKAAKKITAAIARPARNSRGVALIVTILILTILTTLIIELNYTSRIDLTITSNYRDELRAYYVAKAGVNLFRGLLAWLPCDISGGGTGMPLPMQDSADTKQCCWHHMSPCYAEIIMLLGTFPIGPDGFIEVPMIPVQGVVFVDDMEPEQAAALLEIKPAIEDEERKVNVNMLIKDDGTTDENYRTLVTNLFQTLGIEAAAANILVQHLIDYIDDDLNPDDYFENNCPDTPFPYRSKNAPLDTIDELNSVCGFMQIAQDFSSLDNQRLLRDLKDHLTVYPKQINLNTALPAVLQALCDLTIDLERAKEIYFQLMESPCTENINNCLAEISEINAELYNSYCSINSEYFTIRSTGRIQNIAMDVESALRKTIHAVVKKEGGATTLLYWKPE